VVDTSVARSDHYVEIRPSLGWFDLELGAVWQYRELLGFLVLRELKVRYKQAALGVAWAVVQPIFTALIFTAIFGVFARLPSDGLPYPLFALAALLPWTYFSEGMRRASVGLVGDSELVRKVYFPRLIVPLAMVVAPLVDLALSGVVLLLLMAYYHTWPTVNVVVLPLLIMVAMALAFAVGLWLGPLNVRFRDVMHTLPFISQIWLYATPVIYPLSMVPERWRSLYRLNPMVGVVEGFRWALLSKGTPDFYAIAISVLVIAILLVSGLVFFRRIESTFADVI
jgi:lipopolysaccharide transport system permease protein